MANRFTGGIIPIPTQGGPSVKEAKVFHNFADAKAFRDGIEDEDENDGMKFSELVEVWKQFHYLTIDYTTQQNYEKHLRVLRYLDPVVVDSINAQKMDKMISYLRLQYKSTRKRFSFEKELDSLKVILNFYRKRYNPGFVIPIFREHYIASQIIKRAHQPIRSLAPDDLGNFFRNSKAKNIPFIFSHSLNSA